MRVDLGRRDRRVPEQLLHRAKVSAGIEKVRRKGVAERMSGKSRILIDLIEKPLHRVLDRAHGNSPATIAEEERGAIPARTDRTQQLITLRLIVSERELSVVADRDDPLLPTLPAHLHLLR